MMISRSYTFVSAVMVAAVALSGCTGSTLPSSATGALGAASRVSTAAGKDLLYVTGACGGTCILSYPKGKPVAALNVAGASLCSDKSGNVFVATSTGSGEAVVYEFAHGGTQPITTFNLSGILAEGCAVDPKSGDLAVTYLCSGCNYGPVAVFHNAQGTPTVYSQSGVFLSYCGYDGNGNLFADGNGANGFALMELPHGGGSLGQISVNQSISTAGAVQWDGTDLAIEDLTKPTIYRFTISGSTASLAGSVKLKGAGSFIGPSWIQGGMVLVPFGGVSYSPQYVGYWKYPGGGNAKKVVKKHLDATGIAGVTVSVASQ